MKLLFSFMMLLVLLGTGCQSSRNATSAPFKFNLQKGKGYEYAMEFNMKQAMQEQQMNATITGIYQMEVMDETENEKTIKTTYNRIAMKMFMPGDTISADSENSPAAADLNNPSSVMNRLFYAMKGKSFFMKVNNEGAVTAVEGLDAIGKTLLEGTDLDSQSRQKALQAFSSQFNKEAIREMFSNSFHLFPDKPIKVGDSWDKTSYIGPLKVGITTTYTIKDIEGHVVTLDAASSNSLKGNEGEQTSTLVVDARTGLLINGNFHHALKGNAFNISISGTVRGKEL